jgi:hypothetical protein
MDPKKPPAPRRVWRMTTDAPQGEFIDLTEPVDTPQPLVIKRTFHPEKRVFAKGVSAEALPAPVDSTGERPGDSTIRVLNPAKVPSWRASSYDLMTGLTVSDVTDTIPGEIFDELFNSESDDVNGRR